VPRRKEDGGKPRVSLKTLAEHLGLSPATISIVLNDSPAAAAIPQPTKDRIWVAAREHSYTPNFLARSLRNKKTFTIGVLAQEIGDGYGSLVMAGIERFLRARGYFFFAVSHHHDEALLEKYTLLLQERGVEGFIAIDTEPMKDFPLPTVVVSGHKRLPHVTNIAVDHHRAAELALKHLVALGHERIVMIKGQPFSSDSRDRWAANMEVAAKLGIRVDQNLCLKLTEADSSPELGYPVMKELLERRRDFSAVFAYNDISAMGAVKALVDAGLRVPEDVSVVGFDDIQFAAFHRPGLTTIRQPLRRMGEIAAESLLMLLAGETIKSDIAVEPELVIRETTAKVSTAHFKSAVA
jgi:DNA-binding LacI/PurR family transcriptional regulator